MVNLEISRQFLSVRLGAGKVANARTPCDGLTDWAKVIRMGWCRALLKSEGINHVRRTGY